MMADLVLTSANVITMNPSQPHAEAIAVKKDRIVKVGANAEITQYIGKNTKVLCLIGKTVVPGFIDTHIHVGEFGEFLKWLDLRNVRSIKTMQSKLKERVKETARGKWIIGHGWDQDRFVEKRLPTRYDLDAASPDNPVVFYHQRGQICLVNSKALELADITKQMISAQGVTIDKNEVTGELTGVLRDESTNLVWKIIPEPTEDEHVKAATLACQRIVQAGVTSIHWIVISPKDISTIQNLRLQNKLPLRVYVIIPVEFLDNEIIKRFINDIADYDTLRIGGALIFADGYLAARTAALFEPYRDHLESSGSLRYKQEEMNKLAFKIHEAHLQLVIHAMGDKAIDAALVTIGSISGEVHKGDFRTRIEQAAVLNENLLQRLKMKKVIVSVQPCVINSEFSVWSATEYLGSERARRLYPLKTLLKEGIGVSGGSDCPMEPLSPLLGIQAAVTREFFPAERLTVNEALSIYTIDAAYASFEESIKGSVEEGKLADITVISRDPLQVPPSEINNIEIELTIIGGKTVYSKVSSPQQSPKKNKHN
jgi:predicted amidohydrolase YtcJ